MNIKVLKFGGTSLADLDLRQCAVSRILEIIDEGFQPLVVVSAFGRQGAPYATDTLLQFALSHCGNLQPKELALIASCGEIIASVVMASMLCEIGFNATALTGGQAGIKTTEGFTDTQITSIEPEHLEALLKRGKLPVVAGFQGVNPNGEISTLERGGSDISCAALACSLGAESIHIFKDVAGMHTADPAIVPGAQLLEALNYKYALAMALHGAKIIHPDAVKYAMRSLIPIHVCSLKKAEGSTWITDMEPVNSDLPLSIIAGPLTGNHLAIASLVNVPGGEEATFAQMAEEVLQVSNISVEKVRVAPGAVSVAVEHSQIRNAQCILHEKFVISRERAISWQS